MLISELFEIPTTEYTVQHKLLMRFKTHCFSLSNSYNLPIYRFKHGFHSTKTYLIIYKRPSRGTSRGRSRLLWIGRSWIHQGFCRFQIWPTWSGHQEHEDFHTQCCCSARHARYRCGYCGCSNSTMHCIFKVYSPHQGCLSRFSLIPCNWSQQNSSQYCWGLW